MTSVVGVHGVWNYHPNQTAAGLSAKWTEYLRSSYGPANRTSSPDVEVAYYSPALRPPQAQGSLDPEAAPPEVRELIESWLQSVDTVPGLEGMAIASQSKALIPVRQGLERVARRLQMELPVLRRFVAVFFAELAIYLDPSRVEEREKVQAIVVEVIERNAPRVLIAHSLGAVVAWETLMANVNLPAIELFITVGAPLAMPHVVIEKLTPAPVPGKMLPRPPQVKRWVSLADPGDIIAIVRPLTAYFDVDLELEPTTGAFKFHQIDGYLGNPAMAALVESAAE